ncbi:MAG: PfkB family carbohydrate kinase, partial [Sediminibacterium sp.]|nr:PfkB family carbohydrate kinase [Sediminibacterium sp.]
CTIFKPNLKELQEGLGVQIEEINESTILNLHNKLNKKIKHQISLITLSEKGIFFQHNNKGEIIPAHIRNIADVSGAGDTVVSIAALVYAATKNIKITAQLANLAGGIVCEELGTTPINKEKFISEIKQYIKELK